jgi:tetratricopeptide (TPR) repeat protein
MVLRRVVIAIAAATVSIAAVVGYAFFPNAVDSRSTEDICFDPEGPVNKIIPACTALIASGHYHGSDLSGIYDTRAAAYHARGDLALAMADYNESIRMCPTAGGYEVRGALWEEEGNQEQAIADYTRAISAWPEWEPPYEMRAEIYLAQGNPTQAIADFTEAIRFGHPLLLNYKYIRRAVAYAAAGRSDEGLRDLDHVTDADPDNPLAWEVRGQVEAARGERDKAIAAFRTALYYEPRREGSLTGLRQLGAEP